MKGYVFTYGVDGFGQDTSPAHEEGVYLNYDKAFTHLCELNSACLAHDPDRFKLYEEGYNPGDGEYPKDNLILATAEKHKDWETYTKEFKRHRIKSIEAICKYIYEELSDPPYEMYSMDEVEIHE